METGTIRKLINKSAEQNSGKASSFGFIRAENSGEDLFFLPSTLHPDTVAWEALKEGERVEFAAIKHPKGRRAMDVRVLRGHM